MISMSQAAPISIRAFAYHFFHLNLFHSCGKKWSSSCIWTVDFIEEDVGEKTVQKDFFLLWWIRLLEIFYTFLLWYLLFANCRLFLNKRFEGIVDESVESFLNPSPINSCEDLSQCCFIFPMTLFSNLLTICLVKLYEELLVEGHGGYAYLNDLNVNFQGKKTWGFQVLNNVFHRNL